MVAFLLMLNYFGRILRFAWRDPAFRFLLVATSFVLLLGMLFYHSVEGWRWLDSLYFSVITLATVGYGDFAPKTDLGKVFTMIYVLIGIGLLVSIFTRFADAMLAARKEKLEAQQAKQEKTAP
jgi:voltage-gated potassium channel